MAGLAASSARARRNRHVGLLTSFVGAVSRSIWSGDVFTAFVYMLAGTSTHVGVVMGVRGLSQLALAPFFGWLADVSRRETALRLGAALGVAGCISVSWAAHTRSLPGLVLSQLVWGAHWAAANPSADALFADSIEPGERSWWFTRRYQATQLAGVAGPLLSIVVFSLGHDRWSLGACLAVIDAGLAIGLVPQVLLLFLADVRHDAAPTAATAAADGALDAALLTPPPTDAASAAPTDRAARCCGERLLVAPALVLVYDVISALSAGLVVRFFPIFFMRELRLSPVALNSLGACAMVTIAGLGAVAQPLALRCGRVVVAFGLRALGIASFFAMAALQGAGAPRGCVVVAYLLRMGLVNSTFGLTKSIIHDLVPASHRARYAAVDSINQATWAGSAAVGGLIIDRYGMLACFYVTASAQALALVPLWVARQLVPDEQRPADAQGGAAARAR
jgi:MFS family permease